MDPTGRYRLTLTVDGNAVATGWWEKKVHAERKFTTWRRDFAGTVGARVTLVDTETDKMLKAWP